MFSHPLKTVALALVLIGTAPVGTGEPKEPVKFAFKGWFSNPVFTADGKVMGYAQMAALPYGARTAPTQIMMWKLGAAKEGLRIEGPADDSLLGPVAISADGKRLALGLWNTAVRLWDLESGKEIGRIEGSRGAQHLLFAPDGRTLGWVQDGEIHLADAATAKQIRHFGKEKDSPVATLAFAGDGTTVLTTHFQSTNFGGQQGGKNPTLRYQITCRAWEAASGKKLGQVGETVTETRKRLEGPPLCGLFVCQGGKKIVLVGDRGVIQFCDGASRKKDREIPVPWKVQADDPIRRVALSESAAVVAVASARGVLSVWDVATGKELRRVNTSQSIDHLALSPDGKTLAVTYQTPGQVGAVLLIYTW
jgi:WD40 repeat protein